MARPHQAAQILRFRRWRRSRRRRYPPRRSPAQALISALVNAKHRSGSPSTFPLTKGLAPDIWDAFDYRILDNEYRMSFGKLYEFVAGTDRTDTACAMPFGSRPPENDAIWDIAKRADWEVITPDRNVANKEKKIDTGVVAALTRDAYPYAP
jgi:hypothetical protein